MNITKDAVVTFHYTLRDDNNKTLDSSIGDEPLSYLHGRSHIVPGLEAELEGHKSGDKLKVSVPPEKGYGPHIPEAVQVVPKSELAAVGELQVGAQLQSRSPDGHTVVFTIKEIKGSDVILDANHPLAGQTLHFEIEVTDVRKATKEELSHGHAHGAGGHHH